MVVSHIFTHSLVIFSLYTRLTITQDTYNFLIADGLTCTLDGLLCLSHNYWPKNFSSTCKCTPSCSQVVYLENNFKKQVWSSEDGVQFNEKTSFRWEVIPPRLRLRRDVLFSFEDLLGNMSIVHTMNPF